MTPTRCRALLRDMRGRRILVLGDVMLDLGGAGNVAANVRSLGGAAWLAGVVGPDAAAERVRSSLEAAGIGFELATSDASRPTTVKTRIIAHNQQVVRADREQASDVSDALEQVLLAAAERALPSCHAVVVSDYQKGVVTPGLMRRLLTLARRRRVPLLVDPKVRRLPLYRGADLITPNQAEAEQMSGVRIRRASDLAAVAARILARTGCRAALVTRGEHGVSLFERGRRALHVPASAREVYDVTGAGDTVIATLALALAAGARLAEAAVLANHAAGVVVGKLGTAQAAPSEVLAAVEAAP
jgi:rfaE bifunctional protein kinase chain/domain